MDNVVPFVSAGLAIGRWSFDFDDILPGFGLDASSTEPGLKIGGGLKFPGDTATPFVDIMLGLGDIPSYTIRGGITVSVGG